MILILHFGIFPREKVYILELFPGKNNFDFTFWNFSRDFKNFPREKFQNVKFSQGKIILILHFGTFPEILKIFPGKSSKM